VAAARYITICAVRPIEYALKQEAEQYQNEGWQRTTNVIDEKARDELTLFLRRVIDNNEPGYFYLHYDMSFGLVQKSCAFLPLSVALKAQHYDVLLSAKIAQLTDTFQAKLGWLIGTKFNRVGTAEWNDKYPANDSTKEANATMKRSLQTVDSKKIRQGIAELKAAGKLETATGDEILACLRRQRLLTPKQQFRVRTSEIMRDFPSPLGEIRGRVLHKTRTDPEIRRVVEAAFAGGEEAAAKVDGAIDVIAERVATILTDPARWTDAKVADKIVAALCADPKIDTILS
jgi:hypothetical protein